MYFRHWNAKIRRLNIDTITIADAIRSLPGLSEEDQVRAVRILERLHSNEQRDAFLQKLTALSATLARHSEKAADVLGQMKLLAQEAERMAKRTTKKQREQSVEEGDADISGQLLSSIEHT